MASSNKFKSRWQLEEEDHARYRKHNEKTFQRRLEKLKNEGYKCTFEGCQEKFDNQFDLNVHVQAHNQDCWNQLKCNQPKCGKQV